MNEEVRKLEEELNFLRESLESEVISPEEYKREKERIERKITEITGEDKKIKIKEVDVDKEAKELEETEEQKSSEKIEEKAEDEERKKLSMGKKEERKEEAKEISKEALEEKEPEKRGDTEKGEEDKEEQLEKEELKKEEKEKEELEKKESKEPEEKKKSKKVLWLAIILILLVIFFYYRGYYAQDNSQQLIMPIDTEEEEFSPECSSDEDCHKSGFIGLCKDPGTREATCEFKKDAETLLTIVNDDNCKSCKTERITSVVNQLFPNVKITKLDFNSEDGQSLINELGLITLPSYIFDNNVSYTFNFENFERALDKKEGRYIIKPSASGSEYFFKRQEIKNKLELFTTAKHIQAEKNLQEVLELFGDKINFTKHVISDKENKLLKELSITSLPAFLVNNQLKFSGIQPADFIKKKFCELNHLSKCATELSKDIK